MILDRVVGAPRQELGDLSPLVSHLRVLPPNDLVLLLRPRTFVDLRVEVVVPALADLLPEPPREVLCDLGPLLGPKVAHERDDLFILLLRPRTLHEVRVEVLRVPVAALHLGAARDSVRARCPRLTSVLLDRLAQTPVLECGVRQRRRRSAARAEGNSNGERVRIGGGITSALP